MALDAEKIQQIVKQNKVMRAQLTALKKKVEAQADGGDEAKRLSEENEKLRARIAAMENSPADAGQQRELQAKTIETKVLREKIDELHGRIERAEKAAETAAAEVTEAQTTNEILRERLLQQEKELHALRRSQKATAPATDGKASATAPAAELAELTQQLAAEKARVTELWKEIAAGAAERKAAKKKGGKVRTSAAADKQRIEKLLRDQEVLNQELTALKEAKAKSRWRGVLAPETCAELDSLHEQVIALQHHVGVLQQERRFFEAEIVELHRRFGVRQEGETGRHVSMPDLSASLPDAVRPLVKEVLGEAPVVFVAATLQRVDTGGWFRRATCHVLLTPTDLIVVAPGKSSVVEKFPRQRLARSFWNPVTGQIVFNPSVPEARLAGIALTHEQAEELLPLLEIPRIEIAPPDTTDDGGTTDADAPAATDADAEDDAVADAGEPSPSDSDKTKRT